MVDYSVTAAAVRIGANATIQRGTAGGTITAGQAVRVGANTLVAAQADSAANSANFAGIALNGASSGQPVNYVDVTRGGEYVAGATGVVGDVVVVSAANAGGIAPIADLASTNAVVIVGVFVTTDTIRLIYSGDEVVKT